MEYQEYRIVLTPMSDVVKDLLASDLADLGFESFTDTEDGMLAYIATSNVKKNDIGCLLETQYMGSRIDYSVEVIPDQNWNEEWEKNYFQPIQIDDKCVIHSSFHKDVPTLPFDIVIDPKMAFGTGHHETTSLMLAALLELDLSGKRFLDMGCGTAVLAILASMKGAVDVCGIDIDPWAINNALENIRLNNTPEIEILTGGAELLSANRCYDYIFANINRNILLEDMKHYVACMLPHSSLYMSGFYESDLPVIRQCAESLGLSYYSHRVKNQWTAVCFER